MKIQDLLSRKTSKVITCPEEATVEEAARLITEHRVGALPVVTRGGGLVGILSERDVARAVAEKRGSIAEAKVADFMTRNVTVARPGDSVKEAMRTMGRLTIRHLPVMGEDGLLGVISQRDVLNAILGDTELEVNVLRDVARSRT